MKRFIKGAGLLFVVAAMSVQAANSPVIWSGGITVDEREAAPTEGTKLEFFVSSGSYLSKITVSIKDSGGREVVNTVTDGPWLILNLQPGTYTVMASRQNGDTQGGEINVTGGQEMFSYMFPDN